MQVQRISNNNRYNSTFGAKNFNQAEYYRLKSLRRDLVLSFTADKYNFENLANVVFKFAEKFIKFPREAKSLQSMNSYIKGCVLYSELGLRQVFNAWKNARKFKNELNSRESEIVEQKKERFLNNLKDNNIEQPEVEEGMKALGEFFGIDCKRTMAGKM